MPFLVFVDAGTVTLVDNNQVEEVFVVVFVWLFFAWLQLGFLFHPLPIEAHINLESTLSTPSLYLRHHLAEGLEVLPHGLVDEDVAVGKIKDALHTPRSMQAVDDLESGIGLAGSCCHHQEDAVLAAGDSLNHPVDSDALVVTRRVAVAVAIVRNVEQLSTFFGKVRVSVHPLAMELTERQRCGEIVHTEFAFRTSIHVVLNELLTVGGIGERHIQVVGIADGLLDTVVRGMLMVFSFHYGYGIVVVGVEKIVDTFRFFTMLQRASYYDLSSSIGILQTHVELIPSLVFKSRLDEA